MSNENQKSKPVVSAIRKLDKLILNLENISAGLAYAIMVIVVFVGVILRYVTKSPNLFGEEVSRYLMITCVFLGIAAGCRQKVHLSVEMFVGAFPKVLKKTVIVVIRLIVVATYGYVSFWGIKMVQQMATYGQTSPAMRLPLWAMYAIITLGFILSFFTEILMFINEFLFNNELLEELKED